MATLKTIRIPSMRSIIFLLAMIMPWYAYASVTSLNWSSQATPTYQVSGGVSEWAHITWGATAPNGSGGYGLFVAVAATGGVITSPDGINWTVRTAASENEWSSVAWSPSLGIFVAVGASGVGSEVMTSPDGVNWTSRTAASDNWWISVVWSPALGIFVAVAYDGGGNQVMTSPDGINWTGRAAAAPSSWNAVCWGATAPNGSGGQGLFVAVAQENTGSCVMTSPDGITWTNRTAASEDGWTDVTWSPSVPNGSGGHGLFIAVNADGTGNEIMTSPDGVNWTGRSTGTIANNWYAINWADSAANGSGGKGLFVIVGFSNGTGQEIMTSPDGITWTARTNPADLDYTQNYVGLAWSASLNLFVAVDYTSNHIMTSPDGITWTDRVIPPCPVNTDSPWGSVTWAATAPNGIGGLGLFVAVAPPGIITDQVMTSPDGVNWTARMAAAANSWTSVVWSPQFNLFVAVAKTGTGNRVMTSPDGITWTSRASAADNNWQSVVWAPELSIFVAVANTGTGNRVMTSPDGINWTARTTPSVNNNYHSVTWSPALHLFVAVGGTGTGNRVMTSPDGINWTIQTSAADNIWFSVAWGATAPNGTGGQGLFVAVAESGTGNRVMSSPDGLNWTIRTSPVDNNWQYVTWSPELGIFVAVANSGGVFANPSVGNFVMTSPDGVNWTARNDAINNFWNSVAWSPQLGIFAAVANSSVNAYSGDNIGDFVMTSIPAAPNISEISVMVDSNSATITWTTDEEANSQVNYGLTTGYTSSSTPDSTLVFAHSVTLTGLNCNSAYHFQVSSAFAGLGSLSGDSTFLTATAGSCAPHPVTGTTVLCVGSVTTLTDSTTGGTWSSSTPSVATVGSGTGVVTGITSGTDTIFYTLAGGGTVTAIVTINSLPVASPVNNGPICTGGAANLSSNASGGAGGYNYLWSGPGLSSSTAANPTVSPTVTSTYSLTVSSPGSGCVNDSVYTTTITVNPQPSVSPLNNGPVCTGGIANLSSNASGGAGGYNYLWSGPGLSSSTAANPTASPTVTSTYSLTVSSPGAGCVNDSVYTTIITVHPTPSATPGNNGPVCNGGSTNLFALPSGGVGHYLYSWSGPGLSSTTVANPVVTPTITSTYILAINNAAPGCSAVTAYSTTVTVYDEPTASPANSGPVCAGGTVHLVADATGGTGSYRYAWSGPGLSSTTAADPSAVPAATCTYSLTVSNAAPGCSSVLTYTTSVTVFPGPSAAPSNNGPVCTGGIVNLLPGPSGGTGIYIYNWSGPGLASTTAASPAVTPASSATYSLTVSNAAPGCTSDSVFTTTVSVYPQPTAAPTNSGPVCTGGIANLAANPSGGTGSYLYTWSGPGLSSATIANPAVTPSVTGTYNITIRNAAPGCDPATVYTTTITVDEKPSAAPANDGPICIGGTVHLTANVTGGTGDNIYSWAGPGLSSDTSAHPVAMPAAMAVYSLMVSNPASGCDIVTVYTTTVSVHSKPVAAPSNTGPICAGGIVGLAANASGGVGSYIYSWSGAGLSASGVADPEAFPGADNTYSLTVSNIASGCSLDTVYTTTVQVDTLYEPTVIIHASHGNVMNSGSDDTLTAIVLNGGPGATYQWVVNQTYIAGATSSTYISNTFANQDSVSCLVSTHSLCGNTIAHASIVLSVQDAGIRSIPVSGSNIILAPNPNKGTITLEGTLATTGDAQVAVSIVDIYGQVVYQESIITHNGVLHHTLQLNKDTANGMYLLMLHTGTENQVFHMVLDR